MTKTHSHFLSTKIWETQIKLGRDSISDKALNLSCGIFLTDLGGLRGRTWIDFTERKCEKNFCLFSNCTQIEGCTNELWFQEIHLSCVNWFFVCSSFFSVNGQRLLQRFVLFVLLRLGLKWRKGEKKYWTSSLFATRESHIIANTFIYICTKGRVQCRRLFLKEVLRQDWGHDTLEKKKKEPATSLEW